MNALRQVAQLAGLVLAIFMILPLGQSNAKDWVVGDRGVCPGTWNNVTKTCERPYLCEPTECYGCGGGVGNKCTMCGAYKYPDCTARSSGYKADAKQICLQNCRADCTKNHSDVEANLRKCRTSCANECAH